MFQRLKGNLDSFLDTKIAEEQAKQRQGTQSPSRRPGSAASRGGRTGGDSSRRTASSARNPEDEKGLPQKGPDPSEFVIDDEEAPSRAVTPKPPLPPKDGDAVPVDAVQAAPTEEKAVADKDATMQPKPREDKAASEDLPQDVRQKLRKLDKLESRYHDLLRSYRIAHSRVTAIEPFEAALRENTPLTSISDPSALIEYLSQVSMRSDMVMDELKRVTGDRDAIKAKLDDAERRAKDAFDEAAGLREERDSLVLKKESAAEETNVDGGKHPLCAIDANEGAAASEKNAVSGSNGKVSASAPASDGESNDFFSYEAEVPRLQSELEEKTRLIDDLNSENNTLKADLDTARKTEQESRVAVETASQSQVSDKQDFDRQKAELEQKCKDSESAVQDVTAQLDKIAALSGSEKEPLPARIQKLEEKLTQANSDLESARKQVTELGEKSDLAEEARQRLEKESKDAASQDAEASEARDADKKRIDTLDTLVKTLRSQLDGAAENRKALQGDLDTLRTELQQSMRDCKAAKEASVQETSRGSDLADINKQLQKTEKERDDAYHMIVKCGSCKLPEQKAEEPPSDPTKSMPPQEEPAATSQAVDGAAAKKKKNKNKKKKKTGAPGPGTGTQPADAPEPTSPVPDVEELQKEESSSLESALTSEQKNAIKAHVFLAIDELAPGHASHDEASAQQSQQFERIVEQKDSEIEELKQSIENKESRIIQLADKLKGEEELREEIEGLKDDLMEIGNEHVGAKDQIKELRLRTEARDGEHAEELKRLEDKCKSLQAQCKELEGQIEAKIEEQKGIQAELEESRASGSATKEMEEKLLGVEAEKKALDVANAALEKEVAALKAGHEETRSESEKKQKIIVADFDELKSKATLLQTDLAAANELAQTRFKDLTALREHLNKIQPELNTLRQEATEMKKIKDDLGAATANVRKLEAKEKDLKAEISLYKSQAQEKDAELKATNEKLKQGNERKATLEESTTKAQKDLQRAESSRKDMEQAKDKLAKDLSKAQDDVQKSRDKLQDFEKQVAQFARETRSLKSELELKSAQSASSQSLMDSMQDQTRELATQMKEVKERCESLEEELADAHRLLSERSREGETMRRLLADVESRAEARVKDMRERLDLAVEERDRAEEEASSAGRRRARELDDAKNKLREAERSLSRAVDDKEDFGKREESFRSQKEALERRAAQAQEEVTEVRSAMAQLRDAMDEGERQSRDFEKEKTDLRKALEDKQQRLEKLQKSSKAMAEELRSWQNTSKTRQPSLTSARSSFESSRIGSPTPRSKNGAPLATTGGPDAQPSVDYVYLKNVLLQFLEQKDKKHQMQLVPVLGMLLHFDKKDEQKWASAISAL